MINISKERRRPKFEPPPDDLPIIPYAEMDIVDKAECLARVAEYRYTKAYLTLAAMFRGLGFWRQADIAQREVDTESIRLDPEGKRAVENGDRLPRAGKPSTDWENL